MCSRKRSAPSGVTSRSTEKSQRLFFALWPNDGLRQQLIACTQPVVQTIRGRPVPAQNLHITLAFLGNVDARQRACVERMAETLASPAFELRLDSIGHWSRSRVLWFAPANVPKALRQLADALVTGAQACGLSLEARAYRPHLTLMRKVLRAPEKITVEPVLWQAQSFVLVRSTPQPQGVLYQVLREWPLRARVED